MRIQADPDLVIHVEAGEGVNLVIGLLAALSGTPSTEQTTEYNTHFEIQVHPQSDREPFRVVIPKAEGIDRTLLALCATYCLKP